jgi:hypothetical protein
VMVRPMEKRDATADKRGIVEELHMQARKRFLRRRVYVKGFDDLWQIDLVDLQKHSRINKGYKYILTVVDVLSKYAWAVPVRTKSGQSVTDAMQKVFSQSSPRVPVNVQCDDGKEFYNRQFLALMASHNINMYSTFSVLKASVVERFNRTLKGWMFKEFGVQGSYKWIDLLPVLLKRYNGRVHRTIGMRPKDVRKHHEKQLRQLLVVKALPSGSAARKVHFKVGDTVRVSKYKTLFEKGYTPSWSTELFTVDSVKRTVPPVYTLRDTRGIIIKGAFYGQELRRTRYPDTYLVERVLRRKGKRVFVKWLGLDKSHNSWI